MGWQESLITYLYNSGKLRTSFVLRVHLLWHCTTFLSSWFYLFRLTSAAETGALVLKAFRPAHCSQRKQSAMSSCSCESRSTPLDGPGLMLTLKGVVWVEEANIPPDLSPLLYLFGLVFQLVEVAIIKTLTRLHYGFNENHHEITVSMLYA